MSACLPRFGIQVLTTAIMLQRAWSLVCNKMTVRGRSLTRTITFHLGMQGHMKLKLNMLEGQASPAQWYSAFYCLQWVSSTLYCTQCSLSCKLSTGL